MDSSASPPALSTPTEDPFWPDPKEYGLPEATPPPLWQPLERALEALLVPGFAVAGSLAHPPPTVRIREAEISWPLSAQDRETLRGLCTRSSHGHGRQTVLDLQIRSAWELTPEQFSLEGLEPVLREALARMEQALGEQHLIAELYKLQHYERGDHFREHRDSVKQDGMIGTLILGLPGDHEGGDLRVELRGEDQRFRLNSTRECCSFIGFFADCLHELCPVLEGSRTCLVFTVKRGAPPGLRPEREAPETVSRALRSWSTDPTMPEQAVLPLAHLYPGKTPEPHELRGQDRALAEALLAAAREVGSRVSICSIRMLREWYDTEGPNWKLERASEGGAFQATPLDSLLWPWMVLWLEVGRNDAWTGNEGTYHRHHYRHTALLLERPPAQPSEPDPLPSGFHETEQEARALGQDDEEFFIGTDRDAPPLDENEEGNPEPEEEEGEEAPREPPRGTESSQFELRALLSLLQRAQERRWRRLDLSTFIGNIHPSLFRQVTRLSEHLEELETPVFEWLSCLEKFSKLHTLHLHGRYYGEVGRIPASLVSRLRTILLKDFRWSEEKLSTLLGAAVGLERLELSGTRCKTLPEALSKAPLRVLRLPYAELTELPPELGQGGHLQELDIRGCSAIKELPAGVLGPALRVLHLESISISALDLTRTSSLQRLCLDSCPLQRLPVGLEACHRLEFLDLNHAGLPGGTPLPLSSLRELTELRMLNLQGQHLLALPELPEPSRLEVLRCSRNPLPALPEAIRRMTRLQELTARDCALESTPDLSALRRLRVLDLSSNPLRSLTGLSGQEKLETLHLSGCHNLRLPELPVPPKNLRTLGLNGVHLGELPPWIAALQELEDLGLDATGLETIQVTPGQWPALRSLSLSENLLQEVSSLALLKSIEQLDISRNPLVQLPALENWPELRELLLLQTALTELEIRAGAAQKLQCLRLDGTPLKTFPRLDLLPRLFDLSLDQRLQDDPAGQQILQALERRPVLELYWARARAYSGKEEWDKPELGDDEIPF